MKYHLAESCQNTFVLFDCTDVAKLSDEFLRQAHACLKKEDRDDALILINGQNDGSSYHVNMVVLGLDGQIAEFCGNGARACAAYLYNFYPKHKSFSLKSPRGRHPLSQLGGGIYSVKLPPAIFKWNSKFVSNPELLREKYPVEYVETGEPHLILKKALDDAQLTQIGRELNQRTDLFPFGINVNAWHVMKENQIHVKTYERGVQRLTRSCGTGSIACASFYQAKGTVQVLTPGGTLGVTFLDNEVELCGESRITKSINTKPKK